MHHYSYSSNIIELKEIFLNMENWKFNFLIHEQKKFTLSHSESTSRRGRNAEDGDSAVAEDLGGAEGVQEARGNRSSRSGNRWTGSERGYEGIDSLIFLHPRVHSIFNRDRNSATQLKVRRRIRYIFIICEQISSTFLPWSLQLAVLCMPSVKSFLAKSSQPRFIESSNIGRVT